MGNLKFIESIEYSHEVDKMRRDRVEMSFYKYGSAKNNFGKGFVDALGSHDKCIERYKETKNKEYLLDAMNYLMFEFMYPEFKDAYFRATSSEESAGIVGISEREMERIREDDY